VIIRELLENENEKIIDFFILNDSEFSPSLSSIGSIDSYVRKILDNGHIIICQLDSNIVGVLAIYANNYKTKRSFVTSFLVLSLYRGTDVARKLMSKAFEIAKKNNMEEMLLEVSNDNARAIRFYEKFGFKEEALKENHTYADSIFMRVSI